MKILVVGPSVTRAPGGMASVIQDIQESELLNREFEIDVFPSYIDGCLPLRLLYSVYGYARFLLCFRKYDLFHFHTATRGSTFRKNIYLKTVKRAGKRAIVHIHGAEYLTFYDGLTGWKKKTVDQFFHRADLVLALSDGWRGELEKRFPGGKFRTLHNGVETARFREVISDLAECRNTFLLLGRLGRRKGVYDLIDAAELAVQQNRDLQIYLAGDGETDQVRSLVAAKGLEKHVFVLGWVGGAERMEYLKKAATVVLPSYYEGLPMSILEGMAAGKAILSTNVGAIPEVVTEENGILVNPGDVQALAVGLLRLSGDVELLRRMSRANMEKAERAFSVQQMHRRLAEYYKLAME